MVDVPGRASHPEPTIADVSRHVQDVEGIAER
jgi:hypothetical protein